MSTRIMRIVLESVVQAAGVGAWTAAAELAPRNRRLVRVGVTALLVAVSVASAKAAEPVVTGRETDTESGGLMATGTQPVAFVKPAPRDLAVLVALAASGVGYAVGYRRLENRWLQALIGQGHPHPHRALAVRAASFTVAATLPGRLIEARLSRRNEPAECGPTGK